MGPRGESREDPQTTLTMLWRNSLSITGQTHEKLTSICFSRSLKSWNDVTIVPSFLFLISRFCTPPEVKFDAFVTSKHGKENRYRNKFFAILMNITTLERVLRTFALIVSAHPYCACKFTCHVMHRARTLSLTNWRLFLMCLSCYWSWILS